MYAYFRGMTDFDGQSPKFVEIAGHCQVDADTAANMPVLLDTVGISYGYAEIAGLVRIDRSIDGLVTITDLKS